MSSTGRRQLNFSPPKAETVFPVPQTQNALQPYDFGWFWDVTDDVEFTTSEMRRLGRTINVWETPQFQAVERLVGVKRLRFPPYFDPALHGVFCRILGLEILLKSPLAKGNVTHTLSRLEKANKHLTAFANELYCLPEEMLKFFDNLPDKIDVNLKGIGKAEGYLAYQIGGMMGVLQAELRFRTEVSERFFGKEKETDLGRSRNWVAEIIAMTAADIYRTVFPGLISRTTKNQHKMSFQDFYDIFSDGIPDAMRSDSRKLARHIWDGGYKGTPFAPVPE